MKKCGMTDRQWSGCGWARGGQSPRVNPSHFPWPWGTEREPDDYKLQELKTCQCPPFGQTDVLPLFVIQLKVCTKNNNLGHFWISIWVTSNPSVMKNEVPWNQRWAEQHAVNHSELKPGILICSQEQAWTDWFEKKANDRQLTKAPPITWFMKTTPFPSTRTKTSRGHGQTNVCDLVFKNMKCFSWKRM